MEDRVAPLTRISYLAVILGFLTNDAIDALQLRLVHSSWHNAVHEYTHQMWRNIAHEATTNKKSRTSKLFRKICEQGGAAAEPASSHRGQSNDDDDDDNNNPPSVPAPPPPPPPAAGGVSAAFVLQAAVEVGGLDVNKVVVKGSTWPLVGFAVFRGHTAMVKFLIEVAKADIDRELDFGRKCLHIACEYGFTEIVRLLLRHGADPREAVHHQNAKGRSGMHDGKTPFTIAVSMGHVDIVRMLLFDKELLKNRGEVDKNASFPKTLAGYGDHNAVGVVCNERRSSVEMLELLLRAGIDPSPRNAANGLLASSPLHNAARNLLVDHVKLLLRQPCPAEGVVGGGVPVTQLETGTVGRSANIFHTLIMAVSMLGRPHSYELIDWIIQHFPKDTIDQMLDQADADGYTPLCKLVMAPARGYSSVLDGSSSSVPPPKPLPKEFVSFFDLLLSRGARTDIVIPGTQQTLLHLATFKDGHPRLIEMILAIDNVSKSARDDGGSGFSVTGCYSSKLPENPNGCTALERAVRSGSFHAVKALLCPFMDADAGHGYCSETKRKALVKEITKNDNISDLKKIALEVNKSCIGLLDAL